MSVHFIALCARGKQLKFCAERSFRTQLNWNSVFTTSLHAGWVLALYLLARRHDIVCGTEHVPLSSKGTRALAVMRSRLRVQAQEAANTRAARAGWHRVEDTTRTASKAHSLMMHTSRRRMQGEGKEGRRGGEEPYQWSLCELHLELTHEIALCTNRGRARGARARA
jgi:hypothetical protein